MQTSPHLVHPSPATGDERPGAEASSDKERLLHAVEEFQQGRDRDLNFRLVFETYYRPLQRFFARKGLAPEICLDLTQETLLGIYRGLETYRPEARFATWVYKIAMTTYLKSLRARSAAKRAGDEVPADRVGSSDPALMAGGDQLEAVVWEERRRALREAVGELPDQMRKCLTLRLYHELSYRDIAAALQLSIETVKAHLHQGRKKLEERLAAGGEGSRSEEA